MGLHYKSAERLDIQMKQGGVMYSRRRQLRNCIVAVALLVFVSMLWGCGKWGWENVQPSHAPSAPANVTATSGNGTVTIKWDASSGAASYNIYYSVQSGVTKKSGVQIAGVTSPYVVSGLSNDTQYYFVVTADSSSGESVESAQVSAIPTALIQVPATPVNVTATPLDGAAIISWSLSSGATSYNIYYATVSGNVMATGLKIAGVASPQTVSGLTDGVTYFFVVTAVNSVMESTGSAEVSVTPAFGL
ncbi:MAG: fibronectin type III domain-containing protein [Nitrospiraceae bacterium]|nr:fibronectin type III domain-containing protein [Nitrospiraceae bacterium]